MDTYIFYISILALTALVLLVVGLVVLYLRLLSKYQRLESEKSGKHPGSGENAIREAEAIISEANKKAAEIIKSASFSAETVEVSVEKQRNLLNQELDELKQYYAKIYKEALENTQQEAIELLQSIPEDISSNVENQLSGMRLTVQEKVDEAAENARSLVENAYQKAEAEVESYREQRLKQVDESIIVILQEVSRKVLSREISRDEHEKLVMKALEEAKRQHVFSPDEKTGVSNSKRNIGNEARESQDKSEIKLSQTNQDVGQGETEDG